MNEKPELNDELPNEPVVREHRVMGTGIYAGDNPHPLSGIPWGRREDVIASVREKYGDEVADKLDNNESVLLKDDRPHYPDLSLSLQTTRHIISGPGSDEYNKRQEAEQDQEINELDATPYLTEDYDFHNEESAAEYDGFGH